MINTEIIKTEIDNNIEQAEKAKSVTTLNPNMLVDIISEEEAKDIILNSPLRHFLENKQMNERQVLVLYFMSIGLGNVAFSCRKCGIATSTFYYWKNNNEVFADFVEEIEITKAHIVEDKLMEQIMKGNTNAIMYYLQTKGKKLGYGEQKESTTKQTEGIEFIETDKKRED